MKREPTSSVNKGSVVDLHALTWLRPELNHLPPLSRYQGASVNWRLYHITELSEGKAAGRRLAMENVVASLSHSSSAFVYVLSGNASGIRLHIGVASDNAMVDIPDTGENLKSIFEGNFPGTRLQTVRLENSDIQTQLNATRHMGIITGVPSFNEEETVLEGEEFQGIERLVNSLCGESWIMVIAANPVSGNDISQALDQAYELSTDLSSRIKRSVQQSANSGGQNSQSSGTSTSDTKGGQWSNTTGRSWSDTKGRSDSESRGNTKNASNSSSGSNKSTSDGTTYNKTAGTNNSATKGTSNNRSEGENWSKTEGTNSSSSDSTSWGSSIALTSEVVDKRYEEMQTHLNETVIKRLRIGQGKGMYNTSVYVGASKPSVYERLAQGVLSIFQGNQPSMTPLRVHKLSDGKPVQLASLFSSHALPNGGVSGSQALMHSIPLYQQRDLLAATRLTSEELVLMTGLPTREQPGLKIRQNVDFALNTPTLPGDHSIDLGHMIHHGRPLADNPVTLSRKLLSRHVFITGVTGSGKTTTCMKLLLESGLPFLVIEPAKTEYRALYNLCPDMDYYALGREDLTPFRLNPFELVSERQNLASHIKSLCSTLCAAFPMEAAMPQIVEEAIIQAYINKGWDIHLGENFYVDDPWLPQNRAWPTFADMIACLDPIIKSKGMGSEFEEKYRGSLVARLSNLTLGANGRMLNTNVSFDFDQLLDRKVVIELEEIKDEQDKALFMGLVIQRLAECMKHRHSLTPDFHHLTLIEEAHRLLSKPEPGDSGSRKQGVEMFANLLAEVRKYGEGLIIADQIPNKLVADVIKNTNTKIVHRLLAADDRNAIGDAMTLNDAQKGFLVSLEAGETVIYSGGWHGAVRAQILSNVNTSGNEISETQIRQRGQAQQWQQRYRLLPTVSESGIFDSAESLRCFVAHGQRLVSIGLRLLQDRNRFAGQTADQAQSRLVLVQVRFQHCWSACLSELNLTADTLAEQLTRLLLDTCSFSQWSDDERQLAAQILPLLWLAMAEGMAEVEAVLASRPTKKILVALGESI